MAEGLTQEQKDALAAAEAKKLEDNKQEDVTIPKARFDEVNTAKKELEAKLAAIEAEQKTEAEKKMAEEGKLKELLEIRDKEVQTLRIEGLKRDLIQEAVNNNKLHPKLSKMVTGSTEEEIKKSLEEAIAYNSEIAESIKNDKTAKDDTVKSNVNGNTGTVLSTEEWLKMEKENPAKADEYLRKLTEQRNN